MFVGLDRGKQWIVPKRDFERLNAPLFRNSHEDRIRLLDSLRNPLPRVVSEGAQQHRPNWIEVLPLQQQDNAEFDFSQLQCHHGSALPKQRRCGKREDVPVT